MKKRLFLARNHAYLYIIPAFIFIGVFIIGCGARYKNKKQQESAAVFIKEASSSPENIIDLPFGFKFGWDELHTKHYIDSLRSKGIVEGDSSFSFIYKYPSYKYLKANVELFFSNKELCRMAFQNIYSESSVNENTSQLIKFMEDIRNISPKVIKYKIPIYGIEDEAHWDDVTLFIKDNYVAYIKNIKYAVSYQNEEVYIFDNMPKASNLPDYKTKNELASGQERFESLSNYEKKTEENKDQIELEGIKMQVKNSPNDGSVWQVKEYLKRILKDPRSYESIEWGTVTKGNGEYTVRHRYRAKNSFGGYTIEEHIFHLNMFGDVIDYTN